MAKRVTKRGSCAATIAQKDKRRSENGRRCLGRTCVFKASEKPLCAKKIYAFVEGRKMREIYETKIIFEYMKKKHAFVLIMS